jgi:hypothetical protein
MFEISPWTSCSAEPYARKPSLTKVAGTVNELLDRQEFLARP